MSLFKYPFVFVLLFLAALTLVFLWWLGTARKNRLLAKVFDKKLLDSIVLPYMPAMQKAKDILFLAAIFFMFVALAQPQWGVEEVSVQTPLSYVVIAVDVSDSMRARDLQPDRLENAKTMLKLLTESLSTHRVGIIAFTSQAYTQTPLTTDINALKYFVNRLRPGMLKAKGTSISAAVKRAAEMTQKYPGKKTLILLTDGEDHDPEELEKSIESAKSAGLRIIAVGIGTPEGELIPERVENGQAVDYRKDKDGKTVVTRLDEMSLKTLAASTKGVYIKYKNFQSAADQIAKAMQDAEQISREGTARQGYKNRYQIPLAIALVLLGLSLILPVKKIKL